MGYVFNPFTGNLDAAIATTGGTGKTLTQEIPPEPADGSTNVFTVVNEPVLVEIDGNFRVEGYGYTWAAGVLTVDPLLGNPSQNVTSFYNAS